MNKMYYYELCFYHDEDDSLATDKRCSYCIKTEIPPVIDEMKALKILLDEEKGGMHRDLWENLTRVMEISESEALLCFDMDDVNIRVEDEKGVYYTR